jgi:hypothetical protein
MIQGHLIIINDSNNDKNDDNDINGSNNNDNYDNDNSNNVITSQCNAYVVHGDITVIFRVL